MFNLVFYWNAAFQWQTMRKIVFLHLSEKYDGTHIYEKGLGGISNGTIRLSKALSKRNHDVTVVTSYVTVKQFEGVNWREPKDIESFSHVDLAISNNRCEWLDGIFAARKVVWQHNPIGFRKSLKMGDLTSMFRIRPEVVLLSRSHMRRTSPLLPYVRRHLIPHGIGEEFLSQSKMRTRLPPPIAVFASGHERKLDLVLRIWRQEILPKVPHAKLKIYTPRGKISIVPTPGIEIVGNVPARSLAKAFAEARVLLCPGHYQETFCNVAAEATTCGLPTVTQGKYSLSDRVEDGVNGFVRRDIKGFGKAAISLLTDDKQWGMLHTGCLNHRDVVSWDVRAETWEELFL